VTLKDGPVYEALRVYLNWKKGLGNWRRSKDTSLSGTGHQRENGLLGNRQFEKKREKALSFSPPNKPQPNALTNTTPPQNTKKPPCPPTTPPPPPAPTPNERPKHPPPPSTPLLTTEPNPPTPGGRPVPAQPSRAPETQTPTTPRARGNWNLGTPSPTSPISEQINQKKMEELNGPDVTEGTFHG